MREYQILIVDDDKQTTDFLKQLLESEYLVEITSSGEDALEKVISTPHKYDILIVDLKLPGINGLDLLQRINAIDKDIITIILTAYASTDSAIEALRGGAYDYIIKPFNPEEVKVILRRAIEKRDLLLQLRQKAEQLILLYDSIYKLNFTMDLEEAKKMVLEIIINLLNADGSIFFIYSDKFPFWDKAFSFSSALSNEHKKEIDAKVASYLNRHCYKVQESHLILTTLEVKDSLLGVLGIIRNPQKPAFKEEEKNFLELFAIQVAIRIWNLLLYQEAAKRQTYLEMILTKLPEGVLILNASNKILFVNQKLIQIFGLKEKELINKSMKEFCDLIPYSWEVTYGHLVGGILEDSERGEIKLFTPNPKFVEFNFIKLSKNSSNCSLVGGIYVFRDVTFLREIELSRRTFIASLSHALRTPLTSIKGYTLTLLKRGEHFPENIKRRFLQIIDDQSDKLNSLIEELFYLVLLENGHIERNREYFNFVDFLSNLLRIKFPSAPVSMAIPPDFPLLYANREQIGKVMIKLIENALSYSTPGSEILIQGEDKDNEILIKVRNQGPGIPEVDREKIFEKFRFLGDFHRREYYGLGIGLSISKAIIEAHGGKIWCESKLGEYTEFFFTLPKNP